MTCNEFDCTAAVNGKCLHTKDGYCGAGCEKYKHCKSCKNRIRIIKAS